MSVKASYTWRPFGVGSASDPFDGRVILVSDAESLRALVYFDAAASAWKYAFDNSLVDTVATPLRFWSPIPDMPSVNGGYAVPYDFAPGPLGS